MIKRLLLIVLLLCLLLLGAVLGLLGTRAGNLWLLERANGVLPGELSVHGWQGQLLGGVTVQRLTYSQSRSSLNVELNDLELALAPRDLLRGWLHVTRLRASRVALTLPPGDDHADSTPAEPFSLPDSLALPLGVQVDELTLGRFTLNGETPLHVDAIEARQVRARRNLSARRLALSVADTRLEGALTGSLSSPYALKGALTWQRPGAPDAVPEALGVLGFDGSVDDLAVSHTLAAPLQLVSTGHLGYRENTLHLDLQHRWPGQSVPVELPVPVALGAGQLSTTGTLDAVTIDGQADLSADGTPLHLAVNGQAGLQALQLDALTVTSGAQRLTLNGHLDYQNGLAWDLNAEGRALNPALLAPAWPGKLSLDAASQGHWNGDDWALTVAPLKLAGTLKNAPLSLTGEARQDAGRDLAIDLNGRWGEDRLTAKGRIGDQLALDGRLSVTRLSRWYAAANGRLRADWRLRGPLKTPRLSGSADGHDLGFQQWHLRTLEARFTDLNAGQTPMRLQARAQGASQDQIERLDSAELNLDGTRARHRLSIQANQAGANTRLTLNAGLSNANVWKGTLESWTLTQPRLGQWQLTDPASFTLSAASQSLARLCLASDAGDGHLCVQGEHRANGAVEAQAEVRQVPLALANPWLGESLRLRGMARADARFSGRLPAPQGEWQLTLDDAAVRVIGADLQHTLRLSQAQLSGALEGERLSNTLDLVVLDQGELHATVQSGLTPDSALQGEVNLSLPNLGTWAPLIPRVGEARGELRGDLSLAGTLGQPRLAGDVRLADGQASIPDLGITVEQINVSLAGNPAGGLGLDGQARFGEGLLNLQGQWNPSQSPLALTVTARGDNLLVAERTDARVKVSPDLTLRGDGDGLHLEGTLTVPSADLTPRQLPESAVTVSGDQVLVDARAQETSALAFAMAVTVALGDQVHFEGFGLDATLAGQLQVTQEPGKPAQLNGELIIDEGRYRAYGQNLAIDNGRLLFQGAPDNPGLDIRAIRKIPSENQVVGVQLSGTLQEPKASIFSDPALEESEAMSYLLTGRSLSNGTQGDSAKVAQALALYGLQKGSGVTQKIGDTLGLDEVSIGSDWETSDAALMLGKQLSERLYLTYSVGLFDAISTVMLRYTLTRQLHLETRSSSKAQAIDLIWEKELE
ncbi:hypothetical protein CEK62_09725 [Alcanivorax sp. N3-2A]|nr:hypothetical protein CEK62_09725 [Alcanivorax sp. N3-2A]|tara:strand:+ start:17384 stop:20845 length:3462 start_codon:yes stop_codon:yes gene_type:complete